MRPGDIVRGQSQEEYLVLRVLPTGQPLVRRLRPGKYVKPRVIVRPEFLTVVRSAGLG